MYMTLTPCKSSLDYDYRCVVCQLGRILREVQSTVLVLKIVASSEKVLTHSVPPSVRRISCLGSKMLNGATVTASLEIPSIPHTISFGKVPINIVQGLDVTTVGGPSTSRELTGAQMYILE